MLLLYIIVVPGVMASHQEQHPRIISGPSHPMIGKKQGNLTFDWTFRLLPGRTWIESVEDVAFGFWKAPGYLKTKLIVIGKNGEVMIRQNQESKISCTFNMSLLQVAFTVHNLSAGDENEYGLHVELGLARKPLIDVVTLLLEDPPKIVRPPKRNIYMRTGDELSLNCKATGLPRPQVTWERFGRVMRNHSILLGRVNKNDSGLYLCKAKSTAGEDSMKIFVRVEDKEKPTLATEPHCYQVTKTVENVNREAKNPLSLKFIWDASLIAGTVGVIFGTVTDRGGKCVAERAVTIMLPNNTKYCPRFSGYESWCENETSFSVKKNANDGLELIVKFPVQSMSRYLGNVTVNNTILFTSRLQYSYLSTNEHATDRNIQVLILEGPKESENTSGGMLNPCQSSPCLNKATCQGMHWKYNCTCMEGFWGSNCEQGGNPTPEVRPSEAEISGETLPRFAIGIIGFCIFAVVLAVAFVMCRHWNMTTGFEEIYQRLRSRKGAPLHTDNLQMNHPTAV